MGNASHRCLAQNANQTLSDRLKTSTSIPSVQPSTMGVLNALPVLLLLVSSRFRSATAG